MRDRWPWKPGRRFRLLNAALFAPALGTAEIAAAQAVSSNLGLPAAAALGIHAGSSRLERGSVGQQAGLLLDLGWMGLRSLRLQGEVSMLRATLTEAVPPEDKTFHGRYLDFSASVTAVLLGGGPRATISPYLLAGLGVHALSSSFGTLVLDQRYNANRLGSHVGGGLRWWVGRGGRHGLFVEARLVTADEVGRTEVSAGGLLFMGDLVRPRR